MIRNGLVVAWRLVELAFAMVVIIFGLSVWQPGWFTACTDVIGTGLTDFAIEPGREAEWRLITVSGKAYSGKKSTTPLIAPSVFRGWDNKLVIVAKDEHDGYFKLEGTCQLWRGGEPWILGCHGEWARVDYPEQTMSQARNPRKMGTLREHGTFSAELLTGATEGRISFELVGGGGTVPRWLQFILVKGK